MMEESDFTKMRIKDKELPVLENMVVSVSSPNDDSRRNNAKRKSRLVSSIIQQKARKIDCSIAFPEIHRVDLGVLFHERAVDENCTNEIYSNEIFLNENHSKLNNCINVGSEADVIYNHNLKIAPEIKQLSIFDPLSQVEELEEVKVKIEPKVSGDDLCPIKLATFIYQPDLDIKQDFEDDRTRMLQWTDENRTNEIHSNENQSNLTIPVQIKEQNVFDLSSQIEELEEDKVKIESELPTYICQPDLDIKQDFEGPKMEMLQWTGENSRKAKTSSSDYFFEHEAAINFNSAQDVPKVLSHINNNSENKDQTLSSKVKSLKPNSLLNHLHKDQKYNINELVPEYNCEDDGFPSCPFKTLYFDEYLKHVETIHQIEELSPFSYEHEVQREAIMEGWLAREVGPFQCKYCKKATVTYLEMERHQAVYHVQKQCSFYYRKFVPNDTVTFPEQVNLEDPSFINHVIHLPDQIHLCDFKLTDGLLSSTSVKLTDRSSEVLLPQPPDEKKIPLNESEILSLPADNELQCKWKDCYQTYDSQTTLVEHIKKNHVQLQNGKEFTCLWNNCPRKSKPYSKEYHLLRHMRMHTGENPYKCAESYACQVTGCSKKYTHLSSLGKHIKIHTVDEQLAAQRKLMENKEKEDDFVLKKTNDSSNEDKHQRTHYDRLQCKWKGCYQIHDSQKALVKHIKKNHVQLQSGKEFTCFWNNCPRESKPFSRKSQLLLHMRIHSGEKPYKCTGCNKAFSRLAHLTVHQRRRHTGERPYQCQFSNCFMRFSTVYEKDNHQRLHYNPEAYACQVTGCSKKYNHPQNLQTHMKHHTSDQQLEAKRKLVENKENEGDFVLKKSSKSLDGDTHDRTHYDRLTLKLISIKLQCKWKGCYQTYYSQTVLAKHLKRNHVQLQSGKEFTCFWNNCPRKSKPYSERYHLLSHVKMHTGEKPYKRAESYACRVTGCSKKYNHLSSLGKHMKTHTVDEQLETKRKLLENKEKKGDFVLKKTNGSSNGDKHQRTHYNRLTSRIISIKLQCKWNGCYQTYYSQRVLTKHIKKNHVQSQSGKKFTCFWNSCPRKLRPFASKNLLLLHMSLHSRDKPYKCRFQGCYKAFSQMVHLTVHQRKHTGERPYWCQFSNCFKRFFTIFTRDNHQRLHYNPEAYACQDTGCSENHISTLQKHMKNSTGDEQLESELKLVENKEKEGDFVLKKFSNSSDEIKQQELHCDTLQCKWKGCYQSYDSQMAFAKHIEKNHVHLQKGRKFTCFWINCPRKSKPYKRKYDLLLHVRIHSGETPYKCALQCKWKDCCQTYDSQMALLKHIEENHVELQTGSKFTCFWINCRRKLKHFIRKYDLLIHTRIHSGEKAYKCTFRGCNKAFSRWTHLQVHEKRHTGEKPYLCQFFNCSKSFSTSYDKDYHQKMHYDTEAYTCQITGCSKMYADLSGLQKHMENHTVDEEVKIKQKSVENDFVIYL